MRNGRNRNFEKPKNLKVTLKKLITYLKSFIPFIIIAIVLATFSSIFSIIGPNKLSDLTDEISNGLAIDSNKLEDLSKTIISNFDSESLIKKYYSIIDFKIDEDTIKKVMSSKDVSSEDKEILSKLKENSKDILVISKLSDNTFNIILEDTKIDNILITKKDKIEFIRNLSNIKSNNIDLNGIPTNIEKVLVPSIKYKNKTIDSYDQVEFLKIMNDIKDYSDVNKIYKKLDKVPKSIMSIIEPKMNFNKIKNIATFLLIIYLLSAFFNFFQSYIMATVSNNFARDLRRKISHKINKLPLKYFDTNTFGDILSRITNDVDVIGMSLSQSLTSLIGALTLFLGTILMMFITNYIMAITAILSSLIGFIFMFAVLSKSQKYFDLRQVELGKLNGHIEEIYSAHNVVKVYNGENEALEKFDSLNESVYECNKKSQFLSGLMPPMMNFIGNLSYVAVCVVGAILVSKNSITFGVIVAFMIYIRLFSGPLSQIAQGMSTLQTTAAASERVFEFLEEEEMPFEEENIYLDKDKVKGNIEFSHVKFGYNDEKVIIKDFSCNVKSGQKVAIVGPTGAGKTTLVNLLMKFYDINSGDIKIDGVSIKDLTRENIHRLFIMVLQDTWLFNGTIRDNIKYNKENVSDEDIMNACKVVGVDHFIKSLPNGLDYELRDNESISAGQKQLLTIARGMIENAPFLILDEATSSVDTRTEELVQKAMDKLTDGKTSFIIAHRLSTIKNADIILVMNEGNIIEQGNHDDLMKKNGFYAELYNSQFKKNI